MSNWSTLTHLSTCRPRGAVILWRSMKKVLISIAVGLGFLVPAVVLAQSPTTGLLNVYVQVINPTGVAYSPSNFTVAVSGNSPSLTSFQGSQSGTLVSINPGSYAVTVINQYGFNPSYSVGCDNTVSAGQTQLCVITMSGGTFNPPTTLFPWTAAPPPLCPRLLISCPSPPAHRRRHDWFFRHPWRKPPTA